MKMNYDDWQDIIDGLRQAVGSGDPRAVDSEYDNWKNTQGECPLELYVSEDVDDLIDKANDILLAYYEN